MEQPMSETTTSDTSQADAAFGAGFEGKETAAPAERKSDPAPSSTGDATETTPEYVTKAELAEIRKAIEDAAKTSSKAFGTAGKVQQLVNELRAQADGTQTKTASEALGKLKGQFPELGEAIEAVMAGQPKPQTIDDDTFQKKVAEVANKREMKSLVRNFPDWQTIVGSPPSPGHAPVETPFRQWLAGQDEAYRNELLETDSPADIAEAIRAWKRQTAKAPARSTPRPVTDDRAERLRDAVQPRGDSAAAPTTNPREDAFAAGFRGPS
jgi:hypothetical protein